MAYDAARQRVVMSYGYTWEWDGTMWTRRNPPVSPALHRSAMAYDAARQRVVLFGAWPGYHQAQTWEWDGTAWVQHLPVSIPPARFGHAIAYDAASRRVVLFGGETATGGLLADTWEWDGTTWVQRNPATSPSPRSGHAMAYYPLHQRVVLVGGGGDTWEWDGSNWGLRSVAGPGPRGGHAMVCDMTRHRIVLFGGYDPLNCDVFGDTWEWDGTSWNLRNTTGPARCDHAMAYDAARQRIVVFGGRFLSSVWGCWEYPAYGTWLYGNVIPAAAIAFGAGCPGTHGIPTIRSDTPFLGNRGFRVEVIGAPSMAPCVFVLGSGTQALHVGGGCTLYANGALVFLLSTATTGGVASASLPIPLVPHLRGVSVFAQGSVVDPLGPVARLAFTGGLRLVLGD